MNKIKLPDPLKGLTTFIYNLWWGHNQDTWPLFERLNPQHWEDTHNPLTTLAHVSEKDLQALAQDPHYLKLLDDSLKRLNRYLTQEETWFTQNYPQYRHQVIAYFSAEYGIHECLPIYSGGLGILSGDHIKSASDLGIPMVFVGLFYKNGYFCQQIDKNGKQVDVYFEYNPAELPISQVFTPAGEALLIDVDLSGRKVSARVWKVAAGRNTLYLLDTDTAPNSPKDREITGKLYGGDREMRISQEILLGIGGIRLLEKLDIRAAAYHMNEGHSGFFQLERIRTAMKNYELTFEQAKVLCSANCVFTTHTPVPAGNEAFSLPVMHKYFYEFIKEFKIPWHNFLSLGLVDEGSSNKYFSLTVFAIHFSRFQNGVSELHGKVSKRMWRDLWKNVPEVENPITSITNGVHVQTWTAQEMKNIFLQVMGQNWEEHLSEQEFCNKATQAEAEA
ncbi:MAG: alpha-glucan family phosphorylase [Pseudomonadota bacterium]